MSEHVTPDPERSFMPETEHDTTAPTPQHPDFEAWLTAGQENGWVGPVINDTEHGSALTEEEWDEFMEGGDPCVHILRVYPDEKTRLAVEENHGASLYRMKQLPLPADTGAPDEEAEFVAWIIAGQTNSFISASVCETHDGAPVSEEEGEALLDGARLPIGILRLYPDAETKAAVEAFHTPSRIG